MRLFEFDYSAMVNKLRSTYALIQRGATEGEKSAANNAFKRLLAAIAQEYGEEKAAAAEKQAKGSYGKQERPRARSRQSYREPPKRKKPHQEPPRQKQKSTDQFYTHDNGWKFSILRFTDPNAGKRGSDKVWGLAVKDNRFMTFWGAFGKTVQTKEVDRYEADKKFKQKASKGYNVVDANPIDYGYIFTQSDAW